MAKRTVVYEDFSYDLSYEISNEKCEKSVLFLHGWGSNKRIMKQSFGKYFKDFKLIFLDLPGFGSSSIAKPLDTYQYANIVSEFLKSVKIDPDMVFGHSFGGKVATLLKPKRLVLLSSAGIFVEKSLKVKVKIKLFKLLKTLGFGKFYKIFASKDVEGMSKIMYETFKKVVDERFDEEFLAFQGEAMIFWGKEDSATPLKSGEKIHNLIKESKFYPLEGDHFFFLNQGEKIEQILKENLWH